MTYLVFVICSHLNSTTPFFLIEFGRITRAIFINIGKATSPLPPPPGATAVPTFLKGYTLQQFLCAVSYITWFYHLQHPPKLAVGPAADFSDGRFVFINSLINLLNNVKQDPPISLLTTCSAIIFLSSYRLTISQLLFRYLYIVANGNLQKWEIKAGKEKVWIVWIWSSFDC